MNTKTEPSSLKEKILSFWKSEKQFPSAVREVVSVLVVVGVVVLALYLICGTWPAIVTIESGSMIPNMNIGDLVVVVAPDRFGDLQSRAEGNITGYTKFGMPGDVLIYRPNGIVNNPRELAEPTRSLINDIRWNIWNLVGWNQVHPLIHRAMYWVNEGDQVPTRNGSHITMAPAPHEGYITKGDNNPVIDQIGWDNYRGLGGPIEPVKKEWILGKALFTIPYIGYLPLNIYPVIVVVVVVMVLHELYLRSRAEKKVTTQKKKRKSR